MPRLIMAYLWSSMKRVGKMGGVIKVLAFCLFFWLNRFSLIFSFCLYKGGIVKKTSKFKIKHTSFSH